MDFYEKEPGVYVTEEQEDAPVVSGTSVGTTQVLAVTEWGPTEGYIEVDSFGLWKKIFGDYISAAHPAWKQVKKAFLNGALRVQTKRVVHYTDPADASTCTAVKAAGTLTDGEATPAARVRVTAKYAGALDVKVVTSEASNGAAECFDLAIFVKGIKREVFANLSEDISSDDYFMTRVNGKSYYVVLAEPAVANAKHVKASQEVTLSGGNDGLTGLVDADFLGDEVAGTGIHAFNTFDDTAVIICPEADLQTTKTLREGIILWLKNHRPKNFGVFVLPSSKQEYTDAIDFMVTTLNPDESRGAMYGPNLIDEDDDEEISPAGAIAGLIARWGNDATKGIWQNMAGTEAILYGFNGTAKKYSTAQAGKMNEVNINVIKQVAGVGIYVNGSRTLTRTQAKRYRYIGQRLNTSDIMRKIEKNTQFATHQHIDDLLKMKVKMVCTNICDKRFRDGGLAGSSSGEAYTITHDADTDALAEEGIFLTKVGIRNKKTAEFVWFNVYDLDGSISTGE